MLKIGVRQVLKKSLVEADIEKYGKMSKQTVHTVKSEILRGFSHMRSLVNIKPSRYVEITP